MIRVADKHTNGVEGLHICNTEYGKVSIIVRGIMNLADRKYGFVRTMWPGDVRSSTKRNGLPILDHTRGMDSFENYKPTCETHGTIPYAHGHCPFC